MPLKSSIRFSGDDLKQFSKILNQRVNNYFKERNIPKTGNRRLYLKAALMFGLLLVPYVLILSLDVNQWWKLSFAIVAGIGMAGVGMNVMHDGNHGSFSKYSWLNSMMGSSIYILAGNVFNWKIQHNVLHHTYTNIHGYDEDIDAGRILRFSKHSKWFTYHRFQYVYSIFLYGLLTLNWAIFSDFKQMYRYLKRKLSYANSKAPYLQWMGLVLSKMLYFSVWIILPILILDIAWWKVFIGFVAMHYVAGLILSLVFQLAHVMDKAEMPLPDEKTGAIGNTWVVHQLNTTVNFSAKNRIVNWFTGGLNHQIEHHMFPNISHIHYTNISKLVKRTASEFNLPYNEYKNTRSALVAHFKHLKQMGVQPPLHKS